MCAPSSSFLLVLREFRDPALKVLLLIISHAGIGIGATVMTFLTNTYYIVILAWALHFFFSSFLGFTNEQWELPWVTCDNWWNSEDCLSIVDVNKRLNGTAGTKDSVVEYWE